MTREACCNIRVASVKAIDEVLSALVRLARLCGSICSGSSPGIPAVIVDHTVRNPSANIEACGHCGLDSVTSWPRSASKSAA